MKREGHDITDRPVPGHHRELEYTLVPPPPRVKTVDDRLADLEREVRSIRRTLAHHNLGPLFDLASPRTRDQKTAAP
jgi:hypothetical protein